MPELYRFARAMRAAQAQLEMLRYVRATWMSRMATGHSRKEQEEVRVRCRGDGEKARGIIKVCLGFYW